MTKVHMVDAVYNEEDGWSVVTKDSPYGRVRGWAEVDITEEDGNHWDGCKIAEMRADIEIQKRRTKQLNHRSMVTDEIVNHVLKELELYPDRYQSIDDMKKLLANIQWSAKKQAKDNQKKLARMRESLPAKIDTLLEERQAIREQIEKMHKARENKE